MNKNKVVMGAALALAVSAGVVFWAGPGSRNAPPELAQDSPAGASQQAPQQAPAEPASAQPSSPPPAAAPADYPAPEESEQRRLVARSMSLFAEAVNKQDLGALEASGSSAFRNPENLAELRRNVQAYIDQGIDLSRLEKVEPEIEARFAEGRWLLAGAYRVESARIAFAFAFEQEAGEWRVAAMKVELP